jgi:hypothetical protein
MLPAAANLVLGHDDVFVDVDDELAHVVNVVMQTGGFHAAAFR